MEARPIKGERCHICGDTKAPLVKIPCCNKWVCCDTKFVSIRGGGRCEYQHEAYSACHFHYNEKHEGSWKECKECREFFGEEEFNYELKKSSSFP
ncbi:MAG: hypothetical protein HQK53_17345, partial [Oligoflexia bacterium]|nr:hypothetical protein [Oligoflexia bacterium]